MNHKIYISLFVLAIVGYAKISGQEVKKTVYVEGAYRPEIQSAEKYGYMPSLTDTAKIKPNIQYSVIPSHLQTKYTIKPIKPAKLVGSSLDELYKSQLKLGLGNYTTPLAEYSIHNLRSKEYAVGAYVFHRSSHNKLEIEDGNKVPAGYGKNRVDLYGKRFFRKVNAEAELYLKSDKYRFYGYDTNITVVPNLDEKDIRQIYTKVGARAEVYSTVPDSGAFQYRLGVDASYFGDDYKFRENHLNVPLMAGFNLSSFRLDIDGIYDLYSNKPDSGDVVQKHVIQIHPVLSKHKEQWDVKLGANMYFTTIDKTKFNFYPEAQLKFKVVPNVMDAYVGINGKLEVNTLEKITSENPYVKPGLTVDDTRHKIVGYIGLQGKLSMNSGYQANVSFNSVEDAYFFINDTLSELHNQFIAVKDNMELVKFQGELWYSPLSFLDFYWKGSYSKFNLTYNDYPWQVPAYNMSFTTTYNFKEKIFASFDLINYGKRYAYDWQNPETPIELNPIWDLNLRLEYKYSKVLSAFIDGYNLLSKRYYLWNQYPTQKINLLVGFTYKF
jgi:hypothetical protein